MEIIGLAVFNLHEYLEKCLLQGRETNWVCDKHALHVDSEQTFLHLSGVLYLHV